MDYLSQVPMTMTLMKAVLAAGTTTTYSTTGTTQYCIKGKAYSKAAVTNGATPTTDHTTGAAFLPVSANQGSVYVFSYDAAGTVRVSQGQVLALDSAGLFVLSPQFPAIPDTDCPFGYLIIKAGSTASGTWTFGTNNLSSVTGITYTFVDINMLPDRPQVA
jgi:hypothetical protein